MENRIKPKLVVQEPDTPEIASFAGLSSATTNQGTDSVFLDKQVNAVITSTGELTPRFGSRVKGILSSVSGSCNVFQFQFESRNYLLLKTGVDLALYLKDNNGRLRFVAYKPSVFRDESADEEPSFSALVENKSCFVLIATKSTPLLCFCLISLRASVGSISNGGSSLSLSLSVFPNNNNTINTGNTIIVSPTGAIHVLTSMTQTGANVALTSSSPFDWVQVGNTISFHSCFWFWCADANYYPGNYLWNSAVRKNQLPIDVNVAVPQPLSANPIINESDILDDYTSYWFIVFKNNSNPADVFNFRGDRQPATADEWCQSDGSYMPGRGMKCTQTPFFISFGALESGGQPSTVLIGRGRRILLGNGNGVPVEHVLVRVDKNPVDFPTFFTNTLWVTSGIAHAFAVINYDPSSSCFRNPGVDSSAVVELIFSRPFKPGASTSVVDLEPNQSGTINLGDGWIVPLYGYNYIANTLDHKYPHIVSSIGQRLVLTGLNNKVAFSHADWQYRGISWNNFQVSSISFSPSSAYVVSIRENCSKVIDVKSVFGVLVVATDVGIFRISGESSSSPPSASVANTVIVSREIVPSTSSFVLYENKLFYISRNGLFILEYNQNIQELENIVFSPHVSDYFETKSPKSLVWSNTLQSFLVGFGGTLDLLQLSVKSLTWSSIRLATSLAPNLNTSFDGFTLLTTATTGSGTQSAIILCEWDRVDRDLEGITSWNSLLNVQLPGTQVTVYNTPTDVSDLVLPSALVCSLNPNCVQAHGPNHARVVGANQVLLVEHSGGMVPLPIVSAFVTKAFTSDRLNRANRIRGCNLLLRGRGTISVRLVLPVYGFDDRLDELTTWVVGSPSQHAGEGLLNAAFAVRLAPGDTTNLRVGMVGHAEAWQLACVLSSGLAVAGLQFDTSRKGLRRTRF